VLTGFFSKRHRCERDDSLHGALKKRSQMNSNVKVGRVSGIEIGLHYSWFIIAALIVFSLVERFRQVNPSWGRGETWITALFTAVLFFVSLLLHELAHSLVAQKRSLRVSKITLFALGGVSQIQGDATDAKTEFWVAIAGPIASLIIGFSCLGIAVGLVWQRSTEPHTAVTGILVWLGYINISLALFNMIPAFPLDGGRVLRSILWVVTKNASLSTRVAAWVGQVAAFLFILDGIRKYFSGAGFGGLWIAFIGWFLLDAAKSSNTQAKTTAGAVRGMRVSEVMSRGCVAVNRGMSLQDFVDVCLLRTAQRCFAVEDDGRLVGLLTRRDVGSIPRDRWHRTTVRQAMRPLQTLNTVTPETPVLDALKLVVRYGVDQLPVIANGILQGIVFRSQLVELLRTRS
jgi:Zn-dependent protease/predicted transcriptional regulator